MPGVTTRRRRLAVSIETADGAVGIYVGGQANSLAQATACARTILGMDCFARELAYEKIRRQLRKEDRMGAGVIDIALWDLAGKRLGASVASLLGGGQDPAEGLRQHLVRRRRRRTVQPGGLRRLRRGLLRHGLSGLQDARLERRRHRARQPRRCSSWAAGSATGWR